MKKLLSVIVVVLFLCAAFFVFADVSYTLNSPSMSPPFTFIPLPTYTSRPIFTPSITMFDYVVVIPDPALRAKLHDVTGVPPSDNLYWSDLSALTGHLDLKNLGITDAHGIQFCSNIEGLYLDENQLSSLPANLSGLSRLTHIFLDDNNFTSVPAALYTIPNLELIAMRNTPVAAVEPGISAMPYLQTLSLKSCALTSFPSELLSSNIGALDLSNNNIGSLPDNISDMHNLQGLSVSNAGLSELPDSLYTMSSIVSIYADGNDIDDLSSAISGMTSLSTLVINDNDLTALPDEICSLPNLSHVIANNNRIYNLPSDIGNSRIGQLSLSSNRISRLPSSLGESTNLFILDVSLNRLTAIPDSFRDQTFDFDVEYNFIDMSAGSAAREIVESSSVGWVAYERQLTPVSGLVAQPAADSVTLNWQACPNGNQDGDTWNVEGYVVYLTDSGGMTKLAELDPSELTYSHTGLNAESDYTYRVGVDYRVDRGLPSAVLIRGYTEISTTTLAASAAPTEITATPSAEVTQTDSVTPTISAEDEQTDEDTASGSIVITPQSKGMPLWLIILICIIGAGALGAVGILLIQKLRKPKDPPPPAQKRA